MLPPEQAVVGCVLAALATLWLAARFRRWLGGYTGDCLGATQQVSELAFYLGLLAVWLH
jgi:adenosylcobinamide-GDP ribazoletransferase